MSTTIHMKELKDKYRSLAPGEAILDVRDDDEYAEGHVPGAIHVPHTEVEGRAAELARHAKLYVHCGGGVRAGRAVEALARKGLKNLVHVKESGMRDWVALGLPVEKGKK